MLHSQLFFLLFAITLASSLKKDTKLGKKGSFPKQTNCDAIKCPAVERPVCARLVYRRAGNRTVYVVMVNKCEMNYVKCHDGLEAVVVPMSSCGHDHLVKTKESKRSKRETKGGKRSKRETEDVVDTSVELEAEIVMPVGEPFSSEGTESLQEGEGEEEGEGDMYNGDTPEEEYEAGDYNPETGADQGDQAYDGQGDPGTYYDEEHPTPDNFDYQRDYAEGDSINNDKEMLQGALAPMENFTVAIYDEVDKSQYNSNCPSVCPSRDEMSCARCQHGVYRTFLSVCHVRMFACLHTDETMTLIARAACVMSAPYLSEAGLTPRGRVREPHDEDRVLRFLRCKQLSKGSREADPRCYWLNNPYENNADLNMEKMVNLNDYY